MEDMSKTTSDILKKEVKSIQNYLRKFDFRNKGADPEQFKKNQESLLELMEDRKGGDFYWPIEIYNVYMSNLIFRFLVESADKEESIALLREKKERFNFFSSINPYDAIVEGSLSFIESPESKNYYEYFTRASKISYPWLSPFDKAGVTTCANLQSNFLSTSETEALNSICQFGNEKVIPRDKAVVLRTGDSAYFERYFNKHREKESTLKDKFIFCYHIVNPSSKVLSLIYELSRDSSYRFTIEWISNPSRAYYATARLLHLNIFSELYPNPTYIFDMDAALVPQAYQLQKNIITEGGLRARINDLPVSYLPWRKVAANQLFFDFSDGNIVNIAKTLANVSREHFYKTSTDFANIWWVDQNILHEFYLYSKSVLELKDFKKSIVTLNI